MIHCTFEDGGKARLRHVSVTGIAEKEGKILLVLRADHLVQGNKYGLPGGFLDRDETMKEGVTREVLEETGYECTPEALFLIGDDPQRAKEDRQNVDAVYILQVGEQVGKPDNESKEIAWFPLEALPPREKVAFDHYEIIELYKKYKQKTFPLPIV